METDEMELAFLGNRVQPDLGGFRKVDDSPELLPAKPVFVTIRVPRSMRLRGAPGNHLARSDIHNAIGFGHMGMLPHGFLEWLPGFYRKPDWRLTRAEYLLTTRSRLDRRIDDELIKNARTDLAKRLRHDPITVDRRTTIQAVHELSRAIDSPFRWRLEAFLLTDLSLCEIGEILRLPPEFIAAYHDLAFEVRPRRRATDWITCHAMSREKRLDVEYAWKTIARAGGPKLLEIAIAITTGSPLPDWMRWTFKNPKFDEVILRMRGKLMIGAMLARTREQWRALVDLRRKLRRLVPTPRSDKNEAKLQAMLSFLTGAASNGSVLDENQPIQDPEPFTSATTTPGGSGPQSQTDPSANPPSVPAAVSVQGRRRSPRHNQQYDAAATQDHLEELHPDVVEFIMEDSQGKGPLAFAHVELEESQWSAFDDASETRLATISIHV